MILKQKYRQLLDRIPYVKQLHKEIHDLNENFVLPFRNFYAPAINDLEQVKMHEGKIWPENKPNEIRGIELNDNKQLQLIDELSGYYNEVPFKKEKQDGLRYYFDNTFYSHTDAIILYSMMRHFRPANIVEIGSGFSSAVMLDTNELFFDNEINLTFIEPFPERLFSLLTEHDRQRSTVIEKNIQEVPLEIFTRLEKDDFLFVDSSHVVKTGNDVNHIIFEILPILKPGVIIHFHDIFFPFEYPKEWVFKGNNCNEDYFLRAFMMYNNNFGILLFSEYLHRFYKEAFNKMPLCYENFGGNFWIKKLA